jgi:acyl carrier protein
MEVTSSQIVEELISSENKQLPTATDIQNWLVSHIAEILEIKSDQIDVEVPFDDYGLGSAAAIGLTGELEDWLTYELDPTLLYDYPTIADLSQHLAEEIAG